MADDKLDFSDLGGTPVPSTQAAAPAVNNELDFSDLGGTPVAKQHSTFEEMRKLMPTGYDFDKFSKLAPEDQKKYMDLVKQDAGENTAALGEGLSKGAFAPIELINKLQPGQAIPNLRQRAISAVERGIANTVGDQQTQDLYNSIPQEELVKRNVQQSNAKQQAAPVATALGEVAGTLPASMVVGGMASAAGKAAQLGKLGTGIVNTATGAGLGEAQGIINSEGNTLEQRAKDALPSAAFGALIPAALETGAAALSTEGSAAIAQGAKDLRNKFTINALGPNATDRAMLKPIANQIGEQVFPKNGPSLMGPLTTKTGFAQNIAAAKKVSGQNIGTSLDNIDATASLKLAEEQATVPVIKPDADVPNIEPSAMKSAYVGLKPTETTPGYTDYLGNKSGGNNPGYISPNAQTLETSESVIAPRSTSAEILPETNQLGFPRNELNVQKQGTTNVIPVERVINPDLEAIINKKVAAAPLPVQQKIASILSPKNLADEIEAEMRPIIEKGGDVNNITPVIQEQLSKLSNIENPTLSELFTNRMKLDDAINYNKVPNALGGRDDTPISMALKQYRAILDKKLMNAAQQVDALAGSNSFETLQNAKARYSVLSKINSVAQRSVTRDEGKFANALPAATVGGALKLGTMAVGHAISLPAAVAATGVTYAAKKVGNQFAANSLNLLQKAITSNAAAFGEFSAPLQQAATRGAASLAAMHYALYSQDPKYRAVIDPMQEEAEKQANQ